MAKKDKADISAEKEREQAVAETFASYVSAAKTDLDNADKLAANTGSDKSDETEENRQIRTVSNTRRFKHEFLTKKDNEEFIKAEIAKNIETGSDFTNQLDLAGNKFASYDNQEQRTQVARITTESLANGKFDALEEQFATLDKFHKLEEQLGSTTPSTSDAETSKDKTDHSPAEQRKLEDAEADTKAIQSLRDSFQESSGEEHSLTQAMEGFNEKAAEFIEQKELRDEAREELDGLEAELTTVNEKIEALKSDHDNAEPTNEGEKSEVKTDPEELVKLEKTSAELSEKAAEATKKYEAAKSSMDNIKLSIEANPVIAVDNADQNKQQQLEAGGEKEKEPKKKNDVSKVEAYKGGEGPWYVQAAKRLVEGVLKLAVVIANPIRYYAMELPADAARERKKAKQAGTEQPTKASNSETGNPVLPDVPKTDPAAQATPTTLASDSIADRMRDLTAEAEKLTTIGTDIPTADPAGPPITTLHTDAIARPMSTHESPGVTAAARSIPEPIPAAPAEDAANKSRLKPT